MKEWEKSARFLTWKLGQIILTNKKKYSSVERKPFHYYTFCLTKLFMLMGSFKPHMRHMALLFTFLKKLSIAPLQATFLVWLSLTASLNPEKDPKAQFSLTCIIM